MLGLGTAVNRGGFVAAGDSFSGLLDESFGGGAAAAYSVRRLFSSADTAMTIRRDSDQSETDIGFVDGNLDESAINTFCSGTTCTVSVWKDQSGNDNHATQTTAASQPTIYTGGALVKDNGKLALDFTNDFYEIDETGLNIDEISSFVVGRFDNTGTSNQTMFALSDDTTNARYYAPFKAATAHSFGYASSFNAVSLDYNTDRRLFTGIAGATIGNFSGFENGVLQGTATRSSYAMSGLVGIGGMRNSFGLEGTIQEVIYYASDKSANRTSIESNIGDYFTQNTPLLDTYTGAAAAYSLRKLRSAYSGSAIRVRRSNDNAETDIGFNVFGELDTVALAAHCGSNDGFVVTWYDQASTNDATQSTTANQPKIYVGTTGVVTENGKPTIYFDGFVQLGIGNFSSLTEGNAFFVAKSTTETPATDQQGSPHFFGTAGQQNHYPYSNGIVYDSFGSTSRKSFNPTTTLTNLHLSNYLSTSAEWTVRMNGTEETTTSSNTVGFGSSRFGNTSVYGMDHYLSEYVLYDSDKSSVRTSIESNIGDYYTQNTPLLDTYSGAAAAYSLRKLRSDYSGNAVKVRRASDNVEADIGFNVFKELDTVALAAHCGSSDGFVSVWYDQSSSNNATQSTAANQPKIYDGTTGVVTDANGKPKIEYDTGKILDTSLSGNSVAWIFCALTAKDDSILMSEVSTNGTYLFLPRAGSSSAAQGGYVVNQYYKNGATETYATRDDAATAWNNVHGVLTIDADSSAVSSYRFGFYNTSFGFHELQDVIIYHSDQSSNRTNIESNINTFYSIF